MFDTVDNARATFQADFQLIGYAEEDRTKTPGLFLNLTIEQPGAPRMPYDAPLPDVDLALIDEWLRAGAPGVCNGVRACLGQFTVPCVETHMTTGGVEPLGAYDLDELYATEPVPGMPGMTRYKNFCPDGCIDGVCQ